MTVTAEGIVTASMLVQLENATAPMTVTLAGMVTPVMPVQLLNAPEPTVVTGSPAMMSGMTTSPVASVG